MAPSPSASTGALRRRAVTVPVALVAPWLLTALLPLLAPAAAVVDLLTGPRRWRTTRVLAMVVSYAWLESAAVWIAVGLWVRAGFGLRLGSAASLRRHHRFQAWWVGRILGAADPLLHLRFALEGVGDLAEGPVIVLGRHACLPDALLPAYLFGSRMDRPVRMVLKSDLAWVPSLDLFGHRLPNHFVDRAATDPDAERAAVAALGADLGRRDALVIFPEGTYRSPTSWRRALARFDEAGSDDPRSGRLRDLRHLLPPRPGGTLALLEAAPEADVVLLAHVGFDGLWNLGQVITRMPFRRPIEVQLRRIPRAEVPADDAGRIAWLDEQWLAMDRWIDDRLVARAGAPPERTSTPTSAPISTRTPTEEPIAP